uniref:E3 ubiquitin-protein ligase n=1 Tax=Mola mola TaxID=94237 RepID=A0A3Q3X453_MOLML
EAWPPFTPNPLNTCKTGLLTPECAICLQRCVHPVCLPCSHVFCFLCVKGASWHSKRCALCRQEITEDFLERPVLLLPEELKAAAAGTSRGEEVEGDDEPQTYDDAFGGSEIEEERESQPARMPPRGGASSSALSLRSRSPDGQCTVTEV